ncbi:MAG TPA: rhomboid family intramembrane serine protease [Pyrinomonadaceae bacterium]|nr:rhomboid family intramembrane serine protease [Pyrinomonadaceae bacterium]
MSYEFQPKDTEEETPQQTPEEYLAAQKSSIRKKSWWAVGIGGFVVVVHIGWLLFFAMVGVKPDFTVLFRSIFFILGLFGLVAGLYGLYYAKSLNLDSITPSAEAIEFARRSEASPPYYTMILIGSIIAVFVAQLSVGFDESIMAAGFVKQDFAEKGQYWRVLTGGALHGGILHIYFNSQALFGFGNLMEFLSNRAHLAIVFTLAVIGGFLLSLLCMPNSLPSVGASGGIMGLIGFMSIYAYRRKAQLPPDFLRSMLINVGFIAAFGVIAYQLVDNFAHVGGFLVGAVYAFIQVPKDLAADPRKTSKFIEVAGIVALAIYIAEAAFAIFRITDSA